MSMSAELYQLNKDYLWGLCYRMTGNASDAEDIVQETFVRVLERPPRRLDDPLRPWLVQVAMNLSRDLLRRRRRWYKGPWLPSPVPTPPDESPASYEPPAPHTQTEVCATSQTAPDDSPMARYDMLESVSFAFLIALEALTPSQRAVLLLRDVFDYSTEETAQALACTETSVKVTLHRARRAMRDYDKERSKPDAARSEMTRRALEQFLLYLNSRDVKGLEKLLTAEVVNISDGGGEVAAALRPIQGRDKVIRLVTKLAEHYGASIDVSFQVLNGLPAVVIRGIDSEPGRASRFTMHCEIDGAGRIRKLLTVLAPSKLRMI
jgi:RNA polymerase sigma-70 factor (ECF subfamily)